MTCRAGSRAAVAARIGDGLAGADLAGDHPDGVLVHAPGDPGDRFAVAGVAVQHRRGQVPPERHPGETVMRLQALNTHADASVPVDVVDVVDAELPGDLPSSRDLRRGHRRRGRRSRSARRRGPARGGFAAVSSR